MGEPTLGEIKLELEHIKAGTIDIKISLYGNGHTGLKDRVFSIEVKFWIILLMLVPLSAWMLKNILLG